MVAQQEDEMKIDGACLCGAIAFEAQVDPDKVVVCHCLDCQILSGAPYRASVPVKSEDLTFTRGKPKVYVKIAESGNRRALGFCGECGSPFYSTTDDPAPKVYMLRIGAVRQRDILVPRKQIWHKSALSWVNHIADLETFEKGMPQRS
jgi:hypothetical protein